ncbi:UDP-N-acetylglucosamine 2-epimerase (non-hydrolyzing) [Deltaproteobacteria bacterium]|nr:UDP-N-acetylglucosamine 2-epimerase (non-hydrolyzing) [Deltaproteobacteria bacterium]
MKMKIVTIIGARPQFIKAAAVSRAIASHNLCCPNTQIDEVIVHTGQHYDANMSQVFFDELKIPHPNYNLDIGSGSHGAMTGAMLNKIEEVLLTEKADFVLIYGDTNSTLAGAIAAVKLHIPSVHVEAGLRSFNRRMPEEINRIVADQTVNLLLCPTRVAVDNLKREGVGTSTQEERPFDFNVQRVYQVGDVMYDSVLFNAQLAESKSNLLDSLTLTGKSYALATIHRAENTDNYERLSDIFQALSTIAKSEMPLVLPLHPRTRKKLAEAGLDLNVAGLHFIDPVGYLDMLCLERNASVILTDSGGVQKEAYFMCVPCITLRDETEWTETVDLGWNYLAGASTEKILQGFTCVQSSRKGGVPFNCKTEAVIEELPYGDGRAAERIVEILVATHSEVASDSVVREC